MAIEDFVIIPVIKDTDPSVDAPTGWCRDGLEWFNTTDNCLYRRSGSGWIKVTDISAIIGTALAAHTSLPDAHHPQDHSHSTHGDINFTGTVSADGDVGLTGSKTIAGLGTLTFKKGLLVGFVPA